MGPKLKEERRLKEEAIQKQNAAILLILSAGMKAEEIAEKLNLSYAYVVSVKK